MSSPWDKIKEKRTANIGFLTRLNAFRDPTPAEKERALAIETMSWQNSKPFKDAWKISEPYSAPMGTGINLLRTREPGGKLTGPEYDQALFAYVKTPMDHYDILKGQGIDVTRYEKPRRFWHKIYDWFRTKWDGEYIPRVRLTPEFIESFRVPPKEKK